MRSIVLPADGVQQTSQRITAEGVNWLGHTSSSCWRSLIGCFPVAGLQWTQQSSIFLQ